MPSQRKKQAGLTQMSSKVHRKNTKAVWRIKMGKWLV